jgi:iron complex outermembrane receptor protein
MKRNGSFLSDCDDSRLSLLQGCCEFGVLWRAGAAAICLVFTQVAGAQSATPDPSVGDLKQLSVEDLMNIEVTSVTKAPEKLLDADSAIEVVTNEDISRSGASSIPEALELAGNLDIAQKNSHDWAISARGFNTDLGNKLLVLMDGRTLYTPLYSGVFWDVQDYLLEDIDRIEVISGPGGTLWGANAVNGVINITTKSAKDTQGAYVEAGAGSELDDFEAARYGGMLAPNVYFRVYAKHSERGDEDDSNGTKATDAWDMTQLGFRMDADSTPNDTLTLQGDYYGGWEDEPTGGTAKVSGDNVLGRWTHEFPSGSSMVLQTYYDHTYLSDPVPALFAGKLELAPAGILTDRLDTYDVDFQYHLSLGDGNHVVWGMGYRYTHDFVVNAAALAFLPPTLDQSLYNAFVQDEMMLRDGIFLTLGSKVEHDAFTGVELEPTVRLRWDLSSKQMLWSAVSRAVREPSRVDTDFAEAAPPHLVLLEGGANFKSETVVAYELGYRAQLGSKLATSISAYYNAYNNVRSTSFTPATVLPLYFANNLEGNTRGVEFSATYQATNWWQLRATYDFLHEDIMVKPGETDLNDALNETSDPEHQFSIRSSMDLPKSLSLDTMVRWVDTLHNNNGATPGTVPSYLELNARIAWQPTKDVELSLVGQNLLHPEHPEYGFPSPTREEIVRSVYGKIAWRY